MNADQVAVLRDLLAPTGWLDRTRSFARALRDYARTPEGLLIVGTPEEEPWHMTAHLADESRLAGIPELAPTLVRWAPPRGAPPHLSVGIERLESAGRDETLLVVSPKAAPASLLQRLEDARKIGTTIFALDRGDPELDDIAHESLAIPPGTAPVSFDAAQHLVSAAAGEAYGTRRSGARANAARANAAQANAARANAMRTNAERDSAARDSAARDSAARDATADGGAARISLRGRLARLLDAVSGTPVD